MTEYGMEYRLFEYNNGKRIEKKKFSAKPGNTQHAVISLMRRLDEIGSNRLFVNVILWTMIYGFVIRLLMAV